MGQLFHEIYILMSSISIEFWGFNIITDTNLLRNCDLKTCSLTFFWSHPNAQIYLQLKTQHLDYYVDFIRIGMPAIATAFSVLWPFFDQPWFALLHRFTICSLDLAAWQNFLALEQDVPHWVAGNCREEKRACHHTTPASCYPLICYRHISSWPTHTNKQKY